MRGDRGRMDVSTRRLRRGMRRGGGRFGGGSWCGTLTRDVDAERYWPGRVLIWMEICYAGALFNVNIGSCRLRVAQSLLAVFGCLVAVTRPVGTERSRTQPSRGTR